MPSLRQALILQHGGVISLVGSGGKTSLMFRLARELSAAGEAVLTTTTTKIFEPLAEQSTCVILAESAPDLLDQAQKKIAGRLHLTAAAGRLRDQGKLLGFRPEIIKKCHSTGLFKWIIVEADGAAGRPLKAPAPHEPVIPDCTTRLVGVIGLNGIGRPLTERWVFRTERFSELAGMVPGASVSEDAVADVLLHENGIFKGVPAGVMCIAFLNQADVLGNRGRGERLARILIERGNCGLQRVVIGQTLCEPPVLDIFGIDNQH